MQFCLSQQGLFHKAVLSSSASLAIIASQRYIRIRGRGSAPSPLGKAMVVAALQVGCGETCLNPFKLRFVGLSLIQ
jgi:hypothetical protein